jgi:hypothetical protein
MMDAAIRAQVETSANREARAWLADHPEVSDLFITFMSSRACCSGARVCNVRVCVSAESSRRSNAATTWTMIGHVEGRAVQVDSRLIERMPRCVPLTVRGVGPFRRLDLDLTGEQWAELLYPVAR